MTTPLKVFELAMGITDNLDDNGNFDTADNREYKHRTLSILNTLIGELYPFSDTYVMSNPGKRPIIKEITSFDEEIGLDDYICRSVLPEGLAAILFHDENPSMASTHLQFYEERKNRLAQGLPAVSEDIVDVYSGGYYDDSGKWHNSGFAYNDMARWG